MIAAAGYRCPPDTGGTSWYSLTGKTPNHNTLPRGPVCRPARLECVRAMSLSGSDPSHSRVTSVPVPAHSRYGCKLSNLLQIKALLNSARVAIPGRFGRDFGCQMATAIRIDENVVALLQGTAAVGEHLSTRRRRQGAPRRSQLSHMAGSAARATPSRGDHAHGRSDPYPGLAG